AIQQANSPPGWEGPLRPIPTAAVAESLGVSRETTRRNVLVLERHGLVRRLADGLVAAEIRSEDVAALSARRELYDIVSRFIHRLRAAGVDFAQEDGPGLPPAGAEPNPREGLLRLGRTYDRFILRWIESAIRDFDGDLRLMLVHTAVLLGNERAVLEEAGLNALYGGLMGTPDSLRRPVTIAALAGMTGLSRETTRRFVAKLEAMAFVSRTPAGVLARMEGAHLQFCVRRLLDLYPNIRRFIFTLREGGETFGRQSPGRAVA
ncbi:MAG TPA: hypothetical protein VEA44_19180, partial [Caulobacter sp.]|nr:hypothetical protein [Caulobacter sp.]